MYLLTNLLLDDNQNGYAEKDSRSEKHKYGYELKENKHFHHTTTEEVKEDGVRLGCYGYVHPNGKAYSTHYVADNRGYRIVPHHGDILVYPKDGTDARKASFFESFNEDEIKSSNIRYFFPNGCKSTMIDIKLIDPSATPSPYVSPQFSITPSLIVPVTQITPTNPTKPSLPTPTLNPVKPVSPSKTIPINPIVPAEISNQCQDCCEDAQRPTLLMARNSETTCCKKDVAKLSIPISMDKLAKISMTELIEITSETNTITMLKKLLALAEKYQF
ncbi:unnamed protein product [Diamesa tonsa]